MANLRDEYLLADLDTEQVTVREALDVQEESWSELIDQNTFRIPEYQRNYSWEESNRYDFWETLKQNFLDLEPLPEDIGDMTDLAGLYMGAVYVAEPGEEAQHDELEIVDGQQRLSTFQLLLKALRDYTGKLKLEAQEQSEFELKSDLAESIAELDAAFSGTDPSMVMNSEDEDFFSALAAHPDNWQRKVRDVLKDEIANNEDAKGQMYPRVREVQELIDRIQSPIQTDEDFDLKEVQPFAEKEVEEDEERGEEHESQLSEWIRFETSHERMFNAYTEAYKLVEEIQEETNGSLEQRANVTMNFSSFILHAIIIDRCLITGSDPDLRLDIFQSINDKGKPLHNVDKIRARIKHALIGEDDSGPMDEWRATLRRHGGDKTKIENMLQYFVAATEDGIDDISDAGNELMEVFDRSTQSDVTARLGENPAELVTDVSTFSKYYLDVKNAEFNHFSRNIDDSNRQEIKRMMTRIGSKLNASQWYAFVPYVYMKTDQKAPSDFDSNQIGDFLFEVIDAVEIIQLRQSISERSGAAIEGVYVDAVQSFRGMEKDDRFDSSQIVPSLVSTVRGEASELFEDGMIDRMVKNRNWTSGNTAQCLLQRVTSRDLADRELGLSINDFSDIHIEHILPNSPISDRENRSQVDDPVGKYAWLEYFFKTQQEDQPPISDATSSIIDKKISTVDSGKLDHSALDEDVDEEDIEDILDEIYNRFIDDIGNLLLLAEPDNIGASNDLMSKKLPVYLKDDYLPIVVNDFFNGGVGSSYSDSENIEMTAADFEELEKDTPDVDSDAAERVDKSWNYDVLFERKTDLVYDLLQHLEFSYSEDGSDSDSTEFGDAHDRVVDSVEADRKRRINRRNF